MVDLPAPDGEEIMIRRGVWSDIVSGVVNYDYNIVGYGSPTILFILNQTEEVDLVYFVYFLRNIGSAPRLWEPRYTKFYSSSL